MLRFMRNTAAGLALVGGLGVAGADNNVNIIRETDQEKAMVVPKETTTVIRDTTVVRVDTLSDSARNAERQTWTGGDTVGAIRPSETKVLQRRKESKRFATAGLGPAGFGNIEEERQAYDFYLGQVWEVNPHAAIKATGEVASDLDDHHYVDFGIGSNLYMMPTDFSPYIGGEMGLSYSPELEGRDIGMNVGASLGALLFRTSNAQMNIEGNAQMVLSQLDESDEMPTVYSARLGVLF